MLSDGESMDDKISHGFTYENDEMRKQEFARAIDYFKKNPLSVKVSKRDWRQMYRFYSPPQHAYINLNKPGEIWDDNKIIALSKGRDNYLFNAGPDVLVDSNEKPLDSNKIKYGMNQHGLVYAVKILIGVDAPLTIGKDGKLVQSESITRTKKNTNNNEEVKKTYIVMDLLGESMDRILEQGKPLPLKYKLDVARKSAWALHQLHQNQIAHLDIKPGNITIDKQGHVAIIDFETAKTVDPQNKEIESGSGTTPLYNPTNMFSQSYGFRIQKNPPTLQELDSASSSSLFIRTDTDIYQYKKWEGELKKVSISALGLTEPVRKKLMELKPIECLASEDLKILSNIKGFDTKELLTDICARQKELGLKGCDVFAMKRTLYYPGQ